MKGNVDHVGIGGGIDYMNRLNDKNQLFLEGDASYTSFADNILMDNMKASALYAYSVKPRLNLFLTSTHAKNRQLKLDYRTGNGAGACLHGFAPDIFKPILLSLAVTSEHEAFSDGSSHDALRALLRLNFKAPLTDYVSLGSDLMYTPALSTFSDHRFYLETFFQFKITPEKLFFRVTLADEYDSTPRLGVRRNDFAINYSLGLHLGM